MALPQPSNRAEAWTFRFSPGMPAHPTKHPDGGWFFRFPAYVGPLPCVNDQACPGVHYLTTRMPGPLIYGTSIVVVGRIGTAPRTLEFHYETEPSNPTGGSANMRLFLQRKGDEDLNDDFGRFWSNPGHLHLEPRKRFKFTVPLLAGRWSSVFGHPNVGPAALAGFKSLLTNIESIGMTFGGGNSFGHGINVRGGVATMIVRGFWITI